MRERLSYEVKITGAITNAPALEAPEFSEASSAFFLSFRHF
jgi:hypothetical protein